MIGGALQAATQSSDFIIVARVITGIGTGALTGITPVLVAETSTATHRGGFLGYVFIANYLGISVAYWLSFGLAFVDNGYSDVRWRFQLAFQCFPALILFLGIKMLPDTPRYLASAGRFDEAREVIEHVRGGYGPEVEREFLEIKAVAEESTKSSPLAFLKILIGRGLKPGFNLGQRAWLALWLQIMASWSGITAVTAYSPVLLSQAGYTELTQNGLAGGLNTIGIIGTIISAQVVDRFGRRPCLMVGSFCLFAVNLIAGSVYEASRANPERASQFAPAAVAMLFLFNLSYAATWGTIAFLIPTEIWSSDLRAQGNGFGITGWAIGVGMTTLVNPIMFGVLENRTYFLFAGLNLLWIPTVYLCKSCSSCYPHGTAFSDLPSQSTQKLPIVHSSPSTPYSLRIVSSTGKWSRTIRSTAKYCSTAVMAKRATSLLALIALPTMSKRSLATSISQTTPRFERRLPAPSRFEMRWDAYNHPE